MLPRRSKFYVDLKKSERPLKETRNDFSCHVEEEDPLFIDNKKLRLEERRINCPDEHSSNRKIANLEEITEDTICEDLQAKTKRTGPIERNMDMEEITSHIWEHSEIEFIDLTSDEEINQKNSITDFCGIIAGLQDNINTEQRNLREIEIIDLCDEQLHHKNSLNNSCGVISQTSDDITTKVVTKSPMKKNYQKTSKDNCLIEKLSQIVNKLKVPIGGKISVCAGFELLMSALSAGSSNSPSVIQAKSLNENNLQLISSHVYPLKEILHSSSFQLTEEKNLSLGYSEKDKSTQPHRCSTSACECSTCLDLKRTKKVKPSLTKLRKSRNRLGVKSIVEVRNAETNESRSTYEVDKIDGFHIWSFASDTDLGNFSTEQFSRNPSSKSTPNSSMKVLDSYPSGAVLPIEVTVTESDEEPSTSFSSIHQDKTSDLVVKNKKITTTDRKKLKSLPKLPTYCRTNKTLARLKIQNKILRRRLFKALKDKTDWKLDRT